jgi:hypothetical protein
MALLFRRAGLKALLFGVILYENSTGVTQIFPGSPIENMLGKTCYATTFSLIFSSLVCMWWAFTPSHRLF